MTNRTYRELIDLAKTGKMYPQAVLDAIEQIEKIFTDLIADCSDIPLEDPAFVKELVAARALMSLQENTFQVETKRTYRAAVHIYILQERFIGKEPKVFTIRAIYGDGKVYIYVKKGKTIPRKKKKLHKKS